LDEFKCSEEISGNKENSENPIENFEPKRDFHLLAFVLKQLNGLSYITVIIEIPHWGKFWKQRDVAPESSKTYPYRSQHSREEEVTVDPVGVLNEICPFLSAETGM